MNYFNFTWVAELYGMYTLSQIFQEYFILIMVIGAFIAFCLVMYKIVDRKIVTPGKPTFQQWMVKFALITTTCFFVIVLLFSLGYEGRKIHKEAYTPYIQSSTIA